MAITFASDGGSGTALATLNDQAQMPWDGPRAGTATTDTTVKKHGYGSIKFDSTGSNVATFLTRIGCMADAGRRTSMYIRFDTLPSGNNTGFLRPLNAANTQMADVRIDSTGKLRLYAGASGNTLQATGTTTLSTNTWYRICLAYTVTSSSVSEWRVYLDGVLELTASNPSSQQTSIANLRIGWIGTAPGASRLLYVEDVYVDDSTSLADTGDVYVTNKQPNANGVSNAFDNVFGLPTQRWEKVRERPLSVSSGLRQNGTSQVVEAFTLQDEATGDDNTTGSTYLGWCPWVAYAAGAASGTTGIDLVANGTYVALTTNVGSAAPNFRMTPIASSSYPSGNDAVGLRSTGNATDTYLYECGVFLAYILPTADTTPDGTDTIAPTLTETGTIAAAIGSTDTISPSLSDSGAVAASLASTDTITPSLSESATASVTASSIDTISPTLTESGSLTTHISSSDTIVVDLSHDSDVEIDTDEQFEESSDTLTINLTHATTITVDVASTDTISASISHSSALEASVSASDSVSVALVEIGSLESRIAGLDSILVDIAHDTEIDEVAGVYGSISFDLSIEATFELVPTQEAAISFDLRAEPTISFDLITE